MAGDEAGGEVRRGRGGTGARPLDLFPLAERWRLEHFTVVPLELLFIT